MTPGLTTRSSGSKSEHWGWTDDEDAEAKWGLHQLRVRGQVDEGWGVAMPPLL
jgi:hypothetical protein